VIDGRRWRAHHALGEVSRLVNGTAVGQHRFDGKVALVTGATSGIGLATAAELAALGTSVALVARSTADLERAAAELERTRGTVAIGFSADLSLAEECVAVVEKVVARFGRIDILVNAAGTMGPLPGATSDLDAADWDAVFALNARAPFLLAKHVAVHMIEQGTGGAIVNVSSSAAHRTMAPAAYSSSKAAMEGLTRALSAEFAPRGINVNSVAPGITETTQTLEMFEDSSSLAVAASQGPLANLFKRVSEPVDIAHAIVFLCSPESRQITGQTLHVSAGNVV
jgi:NAD(P)-dependent dehydrogenase (short-subunit alcohol dehydrogenase family)